MSDRRGLAALMARSAPRYAAGLAAGVAAAGAMLGLLGVAGWFITASALAGASVLTLSVVVPSAWVRMLALSRTTLRYTERLWTHQATVGFVADLRVHVFRAAASGPVPARHRLSGEVSQLEVLPLRIVLPALVAAAACVGACVFASIAAPATLAVLAWLLAAVFVVAASAALAVYRAGRTRLAARAHAHHRLVEILEGRPEIHLNGLTAAARADLAEALAGHRRAARTVDRSVTAATAAIGLLSAAALTLVTALALRDAPVAMATALILVIAGLNELLLPLADIAAHAGPAADAARRIRGVLRNARPDTPAATFVPRPGGFRTFLRGPVPLDTAPAWPEHVRLRVAPTSTPPEGFTADPGSLIAVTGPTASGKTTLLEELAGLRPGAAVEMLVGDVPLTAIAPSARRACLVPQHNQIFTGTIADNLRLGAPDATETEMLRALATVDLAAHVADLPEGPHTSLGPGGHRLSGGQARRLAIARALLPRPAILLLDEPTTGLDQATATGMLHRLRADHPGTTLVLALHEDALPWLPRAPDVTIKLEGQDPQPPRTSHVHHDLSPSTMS